MNKKRPLSKGTLKNLSSFSTKKLLSIKNDNNPCYLYKPKSFEDLPVEIMNNIFKFLNNIDLGNFAATSFHNYNSTKPELSRRLNYSKLLLNRVFDQDDMHQVEWVKLSYCGPSRFLRIRVSTTIYFLKYCYHDDFTREFNDMSPNMTHELLTDWGDDNEFLKKNGFVRVGVTQCMWHGSFNPSLVSISYTHDRFTGLYYRRENSYYLIIQRIMWPCDTIMFRVDHSLFDPEIIIEMKANMYHKRLFYLKSPNDLSEASDSIITRLRNRLRYNFGDLSFVKYGHMVPNFQSMTAQKISEISNYNHFMEKCWMNKY